MTKKNDRPFDSRRYQGQIERELILGGILIMILLGGGLIAWIWGGTAFFAAMACFALALGLAAAIWLILKILEVVTRD